MNAMPFAKGKSGNPAGRPKIRLSDGRTLTDLAREHSFEALEAVLKVLRDDQAPHAARISAANSLWDRGWGKPAQAVELTGANGGPIETVDVTRLEDHVLRALAVAPLTGETVQ